jgi:hypothetical protein
MVELLGLDGGLWDRCGGEQWRVTQSHVMSWQMSDGVQLSACHEMRLESAHNMESWPAGDEHGRSAG